MKSFNIIIFLIIGLVAATKVQALGFVPYTVIQAPSLTIPKATNLVIRSQAELQRFYSKYTSWVFPRQAVPLVDFTRNQVVVISNGAKPTGGFSEHITNINETATNIIATGMLINPSSECIVSQGFSYPLSMVIMRKINKPLQFDLRNVYSKCFRSD